MERTKKVEENQAGEQLVRFRKIGGGSLRFMGKMIKPGQEFKAYPYQIPVAFRDVIIAVSGNVDWNNPAPAVEKAAPPLENVAKPEYKLQPRGKSKSLFDVIDGQGKVMNTNALSKTVAEQFIEDLKK
jgi:hypothetical protein